MAACSNNGNSVRMLCITIDDVKFESIQLGEDEANDLYNGRKSSACINIMERKTIYGGRTLPAVLDTNNKPIIPRRLVIHKDERLFVGVRTKGVNGTKDTARILSRELVTANHLLYGDETTHCIGIDPPEDTPIITSPEKPQGTSTDKVNVTLIIPTNLKNSQLPVKVAAAKQKSATFRTPFAVPSATVTTLQAGTSDTPEYIHSLPNSSVAGTEKREIEKIIYNCIKAMITTGEVNALIATVCAMKENPGVYNRTEGTTVEGEILGNNYGHIVARELNSYLARTQTCLSIARIANLIQIACSKVADKAKNFTLVFHEEDLSVRLKVPISTTTVAIPEASSSSGTSSALVPRNSVKVAPAKPERRAWENWERRCLMHAHEEVLLGRDLRNIWMQVSRILKTNDNINATNEQCRTQIDWLEARFKVLKADGPSGSGGEDKKELDDEIIDHFSKMGTVQPRYLISSMKGEKVFTPKDTDDKESDESSEPKKKKKKGNTVKNKERGATIIANAMTKIHEENKKLTEKYFGLLEQHYSSNNSPTSSALEPTSVTGMAEVLRGMMSKMDNMDSSDKKQVSDLVSALKNIFDKH